MHGKAMGRPLWLPFCWANSPNCSFPISHSLAGTLFVSLHFILTGEDCSQGQWANSPEKSQLSPAVPRRTSIFISAPSCQRIGEFMSGSWINCFKPWGRRRRFYHQMFSKMFPSKLCSHPHPPPQPLPLTVAKHLVFDTYRMSFCNTNDVFSCCDTTMVWIVMGYSTAVKDLVEWRQTANFCVHVFCLPLSMMVGTRAKLGNKMSKLTDASINHSCSDIWWPEL